MIWLSMQRDFCLAIRQASDTLMPAVFFLLLVTILSIGTGFSMHENSISSIGAVWVVALFATVLGMDSMFRRDHDDGTLDQFLLHAEPLALCVLARVAAFWSISVLPVVALSPIAAWMMGLQSGLVQSLLVSLLLGTPVLALLGAIGSALVLEVHRSAALLALLVLPLFVPVTVLGVSVAASSVVGQPTAPLILWMIVLLLGTMTLSPFATAAALRASTEY